MTDPPALPTDDELVTLFETDAPAKALIERLTDLDSKTTAEAGARCAALHNSGRLDIFRLVGDPALVGRESWEIFEFESFVDGAVAHLDISVDDMVSFLPAVATREAGSNLPLGGFKRWCRADARRWRAVIDAHQAGDAAMRPFVNIALQASDDLDLIAQFIGSGGSDRDMAIHALGHLSPTGDLPARTLMLLEGLLADDDEVNASVLFSAAWVRDHAGDGVQDRYEDLVAKAAPLAGPRTLTEFARIPQLFSKLLTPAIAQTVLSALDRADLTDKAAVSNLDQGLRQLFRRGFHQPVIDFVTRVLAGGGHALTLDDFDHFGRELVVAGLRDRTMIGWLLSGEPALCRDLTSLLHTTRSEGSPLTIPAEDLALSDADLGYLSRKAAGFLFTKPVTAASLLVAVLRVASAEVTEEVSALLFDPLLMNFPGSVGRYLEGLDSDDPAYAGAQAALLRGKAYDEDLASVGRVRELATSEDQRQTQHRIEREQSRRIHKDAADKSVFAKLFSTKLILHGRKVRSVIPGLGGDEPRVMETELRGQSYSWELPRGEIVDTIGAHYQLLRFQREPRPA